METSPGILIESSTLLVSFHHRAIASSILIGLATIGLFGNGLVIISVITTKKLRTITNILVINLAFADILTRSSLPFQVAGLLSQTGSIYPLDEAVCAVDAAVGNITVCCSVCTLVAIAFIRWYVITRPIRGHRDLHTPKKIATVAVIIWIGSVALMVVPPLLGFGTLGYATYYGTFSLAGANELNSHYSMLQGVVIAIALVLTLMFYTMLLRFILRHNKQFRDKYAVDEDTGSSSNEAHPKRASSSVSVGSRPPMIKAINQEEIEITKNLFMVVCVFMLCFLPTLVKYVIPGSSVSTLYTTMIIMANSVVNPIIYGLKNPNFQEAFKRILCCRRE